jgi:hypothetical protein
MTTPQPMQFFPAAANFANGGDTPRAFLERCLARLEAFEPDVGAFVCHDVAAARVWTRSKQPWITFAEGDQIFEAQPPA